MPDELGAFGECFLTGTAAEVTPVSAIGERAYAPGAVTAAILQAYSAAVRPQRAAA